jgi:pimeloyl-ACP methyl ester carboxylesterase
MHTIDRRRLHTLHVSDAQIEYSDAGGDGQPLLLIHAGVFADWFVPLASEPALAGHRVIRMVRAGYTDGPAPTRRLSIGDHATHCAELLEALHVPSAHVVAHSSGAIIALQLAMDRPDLVRTVTLYEPPLLDPLAAPEDLDLLHAMLGPVIGASVAAVAAGDVPTAFDAFMRAVGAPDYRDVLTAGLGPDGLRRAEHQSGYFFTDEVIAANQWRFDHTDAAAIQHPVLLVQGGASPPFVHRLTDHLAAMLPDAAISTVDGQDHLLPLRAPAALADLADAFTQRAT